MSKETIKELINTKLPDNTSGSITPKDIRDVTNAIVEAMATQESVDTQLGSINSELKRINRN